MKRSFLLLLICLPVYLLAQKKPLDHTVYDAWQSIGERLISNDGKWVVYTVTPQEGDAQLFIQATDGSSYKKEIPRGYNALITEDSRFAVFKIKPLYKDTREARIKKKKAEELPKDSFAVVELGKDPVWKVAKVKSYKTPKQSAGWVAYHKEKDPASAKVASLPTQKTVDSLKRTIDSLVLLVKEIKNVKGGSADALDADDDPASASGATEGSDLVLRRLQDGKEYTFKYVADYLFNEKGGKLLLKTTKSAKDSLSQNAVVLFDLAKGKADTIARGGNDFKGFALNEEGNKVAFVAERDTAKKALQKFYSLYLYEEGSDSARLLIDKKTMGMELGMTVSEHGSVSFSKSGDRLLFGAAPIQAPKDTSLIDVDLVKLDIWHYNDDYLQSQQLFNLQNELKRSYLAVYNFDGNNVKQLGSKALPTVLPTAEGDGKYFYAATDTGRRVAAQWSGQTVKDVYAIDVATGKQILVKKGHDGQLYPSATGKYLLLYDAKARQYFTWNGKGLTNVSKKVMVPLYNEEFDMPDDPNPHGFMAWHQQDSFVYVYDRYDVWKLDPTSVKAPINITANGRITKTIYRYVKTDAEERFISNGQTLVFRTQNNLNKKGGLVTAVLSNKLSFTPLAATGSYAYNAVDKAKDAAAFIYTKENYTQSPDLYVVASKEQKLSSLNPQQQQYNWGTAELYKWQTFTGKTSTGILYKPEDFNPAKKYPMIIYFYEKLSDGLYNYNAPAPTPSRLNIPFYVSRGYLVFAPDISYTKGHPAKDAYNYIVSGAQALAKSKWVDAKNIGIQGQSWGGYQVVALITQTLMFKAAWAGAPVANMTSAYGGIRWESGMNRQFQYEKTQSRIGATLWQRPDLYFENSPLFHLPKAKTPLVIMANDADGAVPWYQGIELFTAMRRLGQKVWMLNYNGEAHNLVERKNRKDIQKRQQEYFDWLLKGAQPTRWISEGVPATQKGKQWGLEL